MSDPRSTQNDNSAAVSNRDTTVPNTGSAKQSGGHYFTADPQTRHRRRSVAVELGDVQFTLTSDAGVFSPDALDRGTRYLLQELPPLPPGPYLDLGCGYGPIALTLAKRYADSQVWAVDVNERALSLTRENAAALGHDVQVHHVDHLASEVRFGAIVSNPPIRVGKSVLHALLLRHLSLLRQPDGVAYLVVHKHLGADSLSRWLTAQGLNTAKVGSRQGFRILRVNAPLESSEGTHRDQPAT